MNQAADKYFKDASGNASYRQMGADSGISYSTIRRQLSGEGDISAHVVVALARTYKRDVLEALHIAGFISEEEAGLGALRDSLMRATDMDLAGEILRRAKNGTATSALTEPISVPDDTIVSGMTDDELSNLDLSQGDVALASTHDMSTVHEQSHPNYEDHSQDEED